MVGQAEQVPGEMGQSRPSAASIDVTVHEEDAAYIKDQVTTLKCLHSSSSRNHDYLELTAPASSQILASRHYFLRVNYALSNTAALKDPSENTTAASHANTAVRTV
jgi:hypothetical protein